MESRIRLQVYRERRGASSRSGRGLRGCGNAEGGRGELAVSGAMGHAPRWTHPTTIEPPEAWPANLPWAQGTARPGSACAANAQTVRGGTRGADSLPSQAIHTGCVATGGPWAGVLGGHRFHRLWRRPGNHGRHAVPADGVAVLDARDRTGRPDVGAALACRRRKQVAAAVLLCAQQRKVAAALICHAQDTKSAVRQ